MIMGNEFTYTYSAEDSSEAEKILKRYKPQTSAENKMEQLRKLDEKAKKAGMIPALCIGIISVLILGVGMCCTMVWTDLFALGIAVGIVGIAGCVAAPLAFKAINKSKSESIAPEIIRLSNEIMNK